MKRIVRTLLGPVAAWAWGGRLRPFRVVPARARGLVSFLATDGELQFVLVSPAELRAWAAEAVKVAARIEGTPAQ